MITRAGLKHFESRGGGYIFYIHRRGSGVQTALILKYFFFKQENVLLVQY